MGLFDTIWCNYPLPDPRHQTLEFQTKDLECLLEEYTITSDGHLTRRVRLRGFLEADGPTRDIDWPHHGDLRFYSSAPGPDGEWVEYTARFTDGRVAWIRLPAGDREQGAVVDAAPKEGPPPAPAPAERPAEVALLDRLREQRHELQDLLRASSDHWGYEDPVYRFYHQSFKVYSLQERTRSIVERLRGLAPERPLNPWFLEIVAAGTNLRFEPHHNADWTAVTRPILEAFLHARFFLEMAVRYAHLSAPPVPLPSGYAALLDLYGLR